MFVIPLVTSFSFSLFLITCPLKSGTPINPIRFQSNGPSVSRFGIFIVQLIILVVMALVLMDHILQSLGSLDGCLGNSDDGLSAAQMKDNSTNCKSKLYSKLP